MTIERTGKGLTVIRMALKLVCAAAFAYAATLLAVVTVALLGTNVRAGSVWPAPASISFDTEHTIDLAANFAFQCSAGGVYSDRLKAAFVRYAKLLPPAQTITAAGPSPSSSFTSMHTSSASVELKSLAVHVISSVANLSYGVNETYSLSLQPDSTQANLVAATVFGALRGLETFVQLAGAPGLPSHFDIQDAPRFPYRGLMVDLSRHFLPVPFLQHVVDALAYSKLNIMHLHITDDQSFPIESKAVPELAQEGAFPGGNYTYSQADVRALAEYAADRGVLLVPEFDMPAHSSSWGAGRPDIMVTGESCSKARFEHGDTMNPTVNATYEVLDALLTEMMTLFPPPFLHLGGDEVPEACWLGNSNVTGWMAAQGMGKDANALESYFVNRVANLTGLKNSGRVIMYWEEVLNNGVALPENSIIQAWKSDVLPNILSKGHRATNSFGWYLNHGCSKYSVCVCMYLCMCTRVCVYVYVYECVCVYMCVYMCVCVTCRVRNVSCVCVRVRVLVHTCAYDICSSGEPTGRY